MIERQLLKRIYDLERQLPERNYAKDHSFEEWLELGGNVCSQ